MNIYIIAQVSLATLIFIFPLFFTTLTSEFYTTAKLLLLVFSLPLIFIMWNFSMLAGKKINIRLNQFNLPVIIFALSAVLSTVVGSVNKVESLVYGTGLAAIIALTLVYFLTTNLIHKKEAVIYPLIASAVTLSLLFIIQFLGLSQKVFPFEFLKNNFFTPIGALLNLPLFLIIILPLIVSRALKPKISSIMLWIAAVVVGAGALLSIVTLIRDVKPPILPFTTAWSIAVDNLRSPKNAIFGVGPGNYTNAFTHSKPIEFNQSPLWNIRFNNSSSFVLQLVSEFGILGLFAFLLIIWKAVRQKKEALKSGLFISLSLSFIVYFILPASLPLLFLTFVLLGLYSQQTESTHVSEPGSLFPRFLLGASIIMVIGIYWFSLRYAQGEFYFRKSIIALSQNKGVEAYNNQNKAIKFNPLLGNYRTIYSQTNLALAAAITRKGNLSDQDREDVTTLIQQAIRDAKVAASLNPQKAENWENLAVIYQNLINASQEAGTWAVDSYNQAIRLDPLNPLLRFSLGGVFYSLKNYDEAINQYGAAITLKPDWANAHYNLSYTYRDKGDFQRAFSEMQNTLALVNPNSNDFNKATAELEELRRKLPVPQTTKESGSPETLTAPLPSTVDVKPQIDLNESEGPPLPSKNPTPTIVTPTKTQ